MAVNLRHTKNAQALLDARANIDVRNNDGETAEDIARRRDMPEMAALLEKAKADKYAAIHAGVKSTAEKPAQGTVMKTVRFKPKNSGSPV